jgi:hypothetical protein
MQKWEEVAKILYLEVHPSWHKTMQEVVFPDHDVTCFNDLHSAKRFAAHDDFDVYVCGDLNRGETSEQWARELLAARKKVVVLSVSPYRLEGVWSLNKGEFTTSGMRGMVLGPGTGITIKVKQFEALRREGSLTLRHDLFEFMQKGDLIGVEAGKGERRRRVEARIANLFRPTPEKGGYPEFRLCLAG